MTRSKIALSIALGVAAVTTGAVLTWGAGGGRPSLRPGAMAARHSAPSRPAATPYRLASPHLEPPPGASVAAVHAGRSGTVAVWWRDAGRSQYGKVATDLWKIIMVDVVKDKDATFTSDLQHLVSDSATAVGNPPPVAASEYVAAMADFHRAGEIAQGNGSYARAYGMVRAGLTKLNAFTDRAGLNTSAS